ncbi:MAG: CoA transferase, partial [Betaproteobacteria bacterium]|nr:CoA transferase [Betaproteobacteria bacterium]
MATVTAKGMLAGVRVIDLTSVVIGPLCTQILADHGAEVIKVESPVGDVGRHLGGRGRSPGMGPKFLHLNRNKRSVCLDLKQPAGRDVLVRLLRDADVLAWNVRPASMARLGLSYEEVCDINPRIIYCGMFGF